MQVEKRPRQYADEIMMEKIALKDVPEAFREPARLHLEQQQPLVDAMVEHVIAGRTRDERVHRLNNRCPKGIRAIVEHRVRKRWEEIHNRQEER